MNRFCIDCGAGLTKTNWSESSQRGRRYICRACAVIRATTHAVKNKAAKRRYMAEYYKRHPEKFRSSAKAYYEAHRDTPEFQARSRAAARKYAAANKESCNRKTREWARAHKPLLAARAKSKRARLRDEVLREYGHACQCDGCQETRAEFLAVDHTNGDGSAHRKEIGGTQRAGGAMTYLWLKRHGFPKDRFRLLCHNCNLSRGLYGYCPHEREREKALHQSS